MIEMVDDLHKFKRISANIKGLIMMMMHTVHWQPGCPSALPYCAARRRSGYFPVLLKTVKIDCLPRVAHVLKL